MTRNSEPADPALDAWIHGRTPLPPTHRLWPLYGAGFENLGRDGEPIEVPRPEPDPDELLVRHDACGLCFSDIKVIAAGQNHPRIYRDMSRDPVVLGHEVSMTVVAVGSGLRDRYRVGDRFIIQADIFVDGTGYAYGYEIAGGLGQYGLIDRRVLAGDGGCYLLPVQPATGYAEAALVEPWACVIAAYGLRYRTRLKPGGTTWIVGTDRARSDYELGTDLASGSAPARLLLTDVPASFADRLRRAAAGTGVSVMTTDEAPVVAHGSVDDLVLLGGDADLIERVSPALAHGGILAVIDDEPLERPVALDIGRIHYDRWLFIGGPEPDITAVYARRPVRSELKCGGRALFLGAGGPMGRMHLQRALALADGPRVIVATDISAPRLADLERSVAAEAAGRGVELICLDPADRAAYEAGLERAMAAPAHAAVGGTASGSTAEAAAGKAAGGTGRAGGAAGSGFDDIVVLAPAPRAIEEAAFLLAPGGVMNIFAGLARGTTAAIDLSDAGRLGTRIIGHSASTIDDLRLMLERTEAGELSPNRSVAAIGSLEAAREGLEAVRDGRFPGKIVIYPHLRPLPLTPLPELAAVLPEVFARLRDGREWTVEAERELLRRMRRD